MGTMKQTKRGLTLVEVLVCIAIIAIIAGITATIIMRSKRSAALTKDISNLHQIGLAAAIYAEQYGNEFPFHLEPLVQSQLVDPKILHSDLDPFPEGWANRISRNSYATSHRSVCETSCTYVAIGVLVGRHPPFLARLREKPNFGWLVNPSPASNLDPPAKSGIRMPLDSPYHRLLLDSSVVTRHSTMQPDSQLPGKATSFSTSQFYADVSADEVSLLRRE